MAADLDEFTRAYIACALWSGMDESGEPLDARYSIDDVSADMLSRMVADCAKFQSDNKSALEALDGDPRVRLSGDGTGLLAHAGHDFWLTRNGHGAGFWDGDYPEPHAAALTEASKAFGEADLQTEDFAEKITP